MIVGLWANVTKNPRYKQVDFMQGTLSMTLPKDITMANSAIRVLFNQQSLCLSHPRFDQTESGYVKVGGHIQIDLLDLPEPGRLAKGWRMRTSEWNLFYGDLYIILFLYTHSA